MPSVSLGWQSSCDVTSRRPGCFSCAACSFLQAKAGAGLVTLEKCSSPAYLPRGEPLEGVCFKTLRFNGQQYTHKEKTSLLANATSEVCARGASCD